MSTTPTRPPIWQLIRDAVAPLGRETSNAEIKQLLLREYPDLNEASIACQIAICTVNRFGRVGYPENKKPRLANGRYDFLFATGRGKVTWYDPAKHGLWAIEETPEGLAVRRFEDTSEDGDAASDIDAVEPVDDGFGGGAFALESHLRDYLARNPPTLPGHGAPLTLFVGDDGRDGVEYQTDCGPADLVFHDEAKNFVVFELKLGRGPDAALGQVQRYMGWIDTHLAKGKTVSGVIVANSISDKLKYAAKVAPNVQLMEYRLTVDLAPVALQVPSMPAGDRP
ncbi:endonuclease NucS domain-containing protein [Cupriavidus sp. D39]|uniref:endonuclease NucS domain-containing protein n=1 Tax=Cupriavidus sp. D39 TaxID=2997877 RepID=UPI0022707165|nr:endonuclease NucS domain-containing protein [Cupriavidus sp. D39]MCY0852984.1 endonuclease NucS [Cupriavidus sp. D39]